MGTVYLDYAATTPLDPRVFEAMLPFLREQHGNPSSLHLAGRQARAAVDRAREQVAQLLHAQPDEIIFTGSGTEADNLALFGVLEGCDAPKHLIVSAIEHPAVLECAAALSQRGVAVTRLPVTPECLVEPGQLQAALGPRTRLVSIMAANNVTGTLQPVGELAQIARQRGVLFHTDAVQAVGQVPFNLTQQPIDLLSLSAHKLCGPKGVGALFVRRGVALRPVLHGGGQERGLRPATENVAGIAGLGQAAELAARERAEEAARLVQLRDACLERIRTALPNSYLIGHPHRRLPGHLCLGFAGQEGAAIKVMLELDREGIAVSTGSACSGRHSAAPSHVLQAMGFDPVRARGLLRITLGRFTVEQDLERLLAVLPRVVGQLRPMMTSSATL